MIKVSFYKRYIILDFLTIDLMKYEKWGGGEGYAYLKYNFKCICSKITQKTEWHTKNFSDIQKICKKKKPVVVHGLQFIENADIGGVAEA